MLRRDMTGLLLVLWASLVSGEFTRGIFKKNGNLTCFQCFLAPSDNECRLTQCLAEEKICVTQEVQVYTEMIGIKRLYLVNKRCATTCPNMSDFSIGRVTTTTMRCCSWDRCNRAPGSWEGFWSLPGRLLLPMGLGLFCTLL